MQWTANQPIKWNDSSINYFKWITLLYNKRWKVCKVPRTYRQAFRHPCFPCPGLSRHCSLLSWQTAPAANRNSNKKNHKSLKSTRIDLVKLRLAKILVLYGKPWSKNTVIQQIIPKGYTGRTVTIFITWDAHTYMCTHSMPAVLSQEQNINYYWTQWKLLTRTKS